MGLSELVYESGDLVKVDQYSFPERANETASLVLTFSKLVWTVTVNGDTDEVILSSGANVDGLVLRENIGVWQAMLGDSLSWAWFMVNQQGYQDGLRLESRSGNCVEFIAIASSLRQYHVRSA